LDRGDEELAEAAFRRALQVNPFDRDARHWLKKLGAVEEEDTDG
jgi:hypothetical protein